MAEFMILPVSKFFLLTGCSEKNKNFACFRSPTLFHFFRPAAPPSFLHRLEYVLELVMQLTARLLQREMHRSSVH